MLTGKALLNTVVTELNDMGLKIFACGRFSLNEVRIAASFGLGRFVIYWLLWTLR